MTAAPATIYGELANASDTGQPGGKETGQQMRCYIEPGGAFEHACRVFLDGREVVFYYDRPQENPEAKQTSRKTRYACPNCKVRAWARSGVLLMCEACNRRLLAAPSKGALGEAEGASAFPV